MLIIKYICKICGANGNAAGLEGRTEYVLPDGRAADIPYEIGWCHDCNGLRRIETLDRNSWEDHIREVGREVASLKVAHRRLRRSLVDFSQSFGDNHYRMPLEEDTGRRWQEELERALAGFEVLRLRQSPPRCLNCGGHNFERSGMVHLHCGGMFAGQINGHISLSCGMSAARYSVEGVEL